MKRGTKIALGAVGLLAAGGVGYIIASTRAARRAISDAEKVIEDANLRLPDPSFAMEVPYTDDQFAILDELICECGAPIVASASPDATLDEVGSAIQACVANELYPQFPWPPIPGDHPSASQLYVELGVLARRAVANARICPDTPALPPAS